MHDAMKVKSLSRQFVGGDDFHFVCILIFVCVFVSSLGALLMSIGAYILPIILPLTSAGEFDEKAYTKDHSARGSHSALIITIQIVL